MVKITDSLAITKNTHEKKVLEYGKECGKCGHCCKYGSGFVLPTEILKLAEHLGMTADNFRKELLEEVEVFATKMYKLKTLKLGKQYGECLLLDKDNICKVQKVKPLHCRVGNCNMQGEQLSIWFMLNHAVDESNPDSIREWAIYLKTHPTIPGGNVEDLVPDEKKRKEIFGEGI